MPVPSRAHDFDEDTELCLHCGASREDARLGAIGCEAGDEGNPDWYYGAARTPAEQAAGVSAAEKQRQQDERQRREQAS